LIKGRAPVKSSFRQKVFKGSRQKFYGRQRRSGNHRRRRARARHQRRHLGRRHRGRQRRLRVLGVQDGFKWLIREDDDARRASFSIADVSRIHLQGGSFLGTSRDNPTKSEKATRSVVETLRSGWASRTSSPSAATTRRSLRASSPSVRPRDKSRPRPQDHRQRPAPPLAHPDLRLPDRAPRRRRAGAQPDGGRASTKRWFVVVAMGRKAGTSRSASARPRARRSPSSARSSPTARPSPSPTSATSSRARSSSAARWADIRRRRPRRRSHRQARPGRAGRASGRRARRARPHTLRRG
jgi:hypothetical protein